MCRVGGLLVTGDSRIPAPVDEHRGEDSRREHPRRRDIKGVEPRQADAMRFRHPVAGVHLHQRRACQQAEDDHLDAQQQILELGRDLDPDPRDVGHDDDPGDPCHRHPQVGRRQAVGPNQQVAVGTGDLGEVCHHDHVCGEDAPATHPAPRRAKRPRRPGERRATVGLGLVQLLVGDRDHVHRNEREQHDDR